MLNNSTPLYPLCVMYTSVLLNVSDSKCSLERGMCSWSNTQNVKVDKLDWELTTQEAERHYSTPPEDHTLGTEKGKPERETEAVDCEYCVIKNHVFHFSSTRSESGKAREQHFFVCLFLYKKCT